MADHPTPDWIGPALGAAGTVVTGWLAWLGVRFNARTVTKVDPQDKLNQGFVGLAEQMRMELKAASRERNHLNQVLEEERRSWRQEREAWRVERDALMGEIAQLQAVAHGFENLLRRQGVNLPERKVYTAKTVEVVDATLRQDPVPPSGD